MSPTSALKADSHLFKSEDSYKPYLEKCEYESLRCVYCMATLPISHTK